MNSEESRFPQQPHRTSTFDARCQFPPLEIGSENPHYDSRYFEWQSSGGETLADFERGKFSPFVCASDVVLDFGCGDGRILAGIPCGERYGVEINPAARAVAKHYVNVYADISEISPHVMFDVIISNHALEHVDHPIQQLDRFKLRLKPGGRVVLVVPSETWLLQRTYRPGDINQHLYTWTPLSLGNLLTRAGFVVERVDLLRHRFLPKPSIMCRIMPKSLFGFCCRLWGTLTWTRQLRVVAVRTPQMGARIQTT